MNLKTINFLDHHDSFSANILDLLEKESGPAAQIRRYFCDDVDQLQQLSKSDCPLVVSPGPKSPDQLPASREVLGLLVGKVPILGVCLGHQLLANLHGSEIFPASSPHHGAATEIQHSGKDELFDQVPRIFRATRYNSLVVSKPNTGEVIARNILHREIEAIRYPYALPTYGIQFHPESYLSEYGQIIFRNWLNQI